MTRRGLGPSLSIRPVAQSELSARFMIVSDLQAPVLLDWTFSGLR